MAEYIVSGPSTPERLEAAGMEVVVRCDRCDKCAKRTGCFLTYPPRDFYEYWCQHFERYVDPNNYCAWGKRRS